MKKIQKETHVWDAAKVTALVTKLNRYRNEYYILAAPSVSDAVYDHLFDELQDAEDRQESRNIEFRYFTCSFYKKGTCHIEFKDGELLKKFNIFGARQKGWLPPAYGRKAYQKMGREEREVVDSFEGKDSYAETCSRPEYYLYEPKDRQNMLESLSA